MQNIQAMIQEVKTTLAGVERISCDHAEQLLKLLDRAPQESLIMLVKDRVKFCRLPAQRRLMEKFGMTIEQIRAL